MINTARACTLLLAGGWALLSWPAYAQGSFKTTSEAAAAAVRNASRFETEFKRGVTTQEEVRRVFGKPTGTGGAFFPTARRPNEVWAYENVEMEIVGTSRDPSAAIQAKQRWDAVLIFFDGNLYDGFMWYTSGTEVTGVAR
jgi:hypothetical protein